MKHVVVVLFLAIHIVNGQIASDVTANFQKSIAYICTNPGLNQIPEATYQKFAHCADVSI